MSVWKNTPHYVIIYILHIANREKNGGGEGGDTNAQCNPTFWKQKSAF